MRVAYRASREGSGDLVFVPNWFTNCEHLPEIGGIGVHIGARVTALAAANDVLVSSRLRDLIIGFARSKAQSYRLGVGNVGRHFPEGGMAVHFCQPPNNFCHRNYPADLHV
ncbi:hypothetical protein BTO20_10550 [Mycobacterium dioxanotrophicus]|uniref:Uncharacterized protein n=1 Tax=Mycobacterium dioxanotrophicus TaxID=482462 RepID=A0A1Y0C1I5_9MYCO|nr:hypothetical protein BTO20_10550 [Mycobacterium dioxanotrophicus]